MATHILLLRAGMRAERAPFWYVLGGPGSRRQPHLRARRRFQSSRPSCIAGPLSRRGRPARAGGRVSAGRQRVRRHNRERGPCRPTASPSAGPGVRRFWLPAIDSRIRGKSLSQKLVGKNETGKDGTHLENRVPYRSIYHCGPPPSTPEVIDGSIQS